MGLQAARVVEVWAPAPTGGAGKVGSGYLLDETLVLTAGHVADRAAGGPCDVRPLGVERWITGCEVIWRGESCDAALLRVGEQAVSVKGGRCSLGSLPDDEPMACRAVGFPLAQADGDKPDGASDTEDLLGEIRPLTGLKRGNLTVHIVGSVPTPLPFGQSPWEGMSGAALFSGGLLVGVVRVDPARFGTDRLEAVPVTDLAAERGFRAALTGDPDAALNLVTAQSASAPLRASLQWGFAPLLEEYNARIFGGRRAAFNRIGEFVRVPAGGYLIITAPGGFGKTSLMANLVSVNQDAFAYHFFSTIYGPGDLSESFFLRNVVEQLARWHGRSGELPTQLPDLRALYSKLLDEPLDVSHVLVLDGLDEVRDWSLEPYLKRRLPKRLHVIATVRDVGQDWRRQYGFPPDQITVLTLGGLDRREVIDVLKAAGGSARALADNRAAVDQFVRIAAYPDDPELGADPMYMRFLAEDAATTSLTAATLATRPAGLDAYLDDWWKKIKLAMGDEPTLDLFGFLTAALGPLPRADIERLSPSLNHRWDSDFFDDVLQGVRRWIVGGEHGYSLMHPRLRDYMAGKIKLAPYAERLQEFCRDWRTHRSNYALSYGAQHLLQAGDLQALSALICREWMLVRLRQRGSYAAFAGDVSLAHGAVTARTPDDVVELTRLSHLYATLGSFATVVPDDALSVLVRLGRSDRALRLAALIRDPATKVTAYRVIGEALLDVGDVERGSEVLHRALAAVDKIPRDRADALGELAPAFARAGRFDHLAPRLDPSARGRAAYALAEARDPASAIEALQHLAEIAEHSDDLRHRAFVLALAIEGIAQLGDAGLAARLASDLEHVAREVAERDPGAYVVGTASAALARTGSRGIALNLAGRAREALAVNTSWDRPHHASRIAAAYAAAAEYDTAMEVARDSLHRDHSASAVLAVVWVAVRAGAAEAVAPGVHALAETLADVEGQSSMSATRADIAETLGRLGESDAAAALAGSIRDGWRSGGFRRLASCHATTGSIDDALAAAESTTTEQHRSEALRDIVCALVGIGEVIRAAEIAGQIVDPDRAAEARSAVAYGLLRGGHHGAAEKMIDQVLSRADSLVDRDHLAVALCAVARQMDGNAVDRIDALVAAAIDIAESDANPAAHHHRLAGAVEALRTVGETLAALRGPKEAVQIMQRAVEVAHMMPDGPDRDRVLRDIIVARARLGSLPAADGTSLAAAIGHPDVRLGALHEAMTTLYDRGDPAAADLFRQALRDCRSEADWPSSFDNLKAAGQMLAASGVLSSSEHTEANAQIDSARTAAAMRRPTRPAARAAALRTGASSGVAPPAPSVPRTDDAANDGGLERVDELTDRVLELFDNHEFDAVSGAADAALDAARAIEARDSRRDWALERIARVLAIVGYRSRAVDVLQELPEWPRGTAFSRLALEYDRVGHPEAAMCVWLAGFTRLEHTSRQLVFRALQSAPSSVGGDVLWSLCEVVLGIERWWQAPQDDGG